jgi:hypothetical protein
LAGYYRKPAFPPLAAKGRTADSALVNESAVWPPIAFGYAALLFLGAFWTGIHDSRQEPSAEIWASAPQVFLLERSFLKCVRQKLATIGAVLTAEEEAAILAYQRDEWAMAASLDLASAPIHRVGRLTFIECSWFAAVLYLPALALRP